MTLEFTELDQLHNLTDEQLESERCMASCTWTDGPSFEHMRAIGREMTRRGLTIPVLTSRDVPKGTPEMSALVRRNPSDVIRDVFLLHDGELSLVQTEALIANMAWTYGNDVREAFARLIESGMWERCGQSFRNPIQVTMAEREAELRAADPK